MPSMQAMLLLAAQNYLSKQTLERIPESDLIMTRQANVDQFDMIVNSNIAVSFSGAIELLFQIGAIPYAKNILDLACGPGHFSLFLAKYSKGNVTGVDLSDQMLAKAHDNAKKEGLSDRVQFLSGDITNLNQFSDKQFDLITCTNSAHHLPSPALLTSMMDEIDRVLTDQGTGFIMDLTRLRTAGCLNKYINLMGKEYLEHGLEALYEDFHNSMFAAWTPGELRSAISMNSSRSWFHFSIFPLPINQFLFAKPKGWKPKKPKSFFNWPDSKIPIRTDLQKDYTAYRQSLFLSYRWFLKQLN
ncbi:MAG: class I SAM-dependent methyltransferase [Nitrosomonas sp.]|nr:class I SAM-dependent methyltransferase [Nitrosomonas sp.]MCW5607158.1 class I SAM-dependent methyltransferase [Nitrosomonas sp.]